MVPATSIPTVSAASMLLSAVGFHAITAGTGHRMTQPVKLIPCSRFHIEAISQCITWYY